jgi:hypothetical protein
MRGESQLKLFFENHLTTVRAKFIFQSSLVAPSLIHTFSS